MSVSSTTGTGANAIAQEILRVFDSNKDGQLSSTEFSAVLGKLLGAMPNAATSNAASTTATSSSETTRRTDQLGGFNLDKLETSQSTKYKFARAASQFDVSVVKSKADAEKLLNDMKPAMEKEGLQVLEISKDRIKVMHEGAPIWVDVINSASVGSKSFQWLPDGV